VSERSEVEVIKDPQVEKKTEFEKISGERRAISEQMRQEGRSVYETLEFFDNDYTSAEIEYQKKTGCELISDPYESEKHDIAITKTCSVVVPAYNNFLRLKQSLLSIQASTFNAKYPQQLEVVVVDDGSPDENIGEEIEALGLSDLNIKVFRQSNGRAAKARYSGAIRSSGDILIMTDPDVVYTPTMIEEYMKRHEVLDNVVMFGFRDEIDSNDSRLSPESIAEGSLAQLPQKIGNDPRVANRGMEDSQWLKLSGHNKQLPIDIGDDAYDWRIYSIAWGMSVSGKREDFAQTYAGYDDRYIGYGAEDEDLTARLISLGNFVIPNTGGFCYHQRHISSANPEKRAINVAVLKENLNLPLKKQEMSSLQDTDAKLVYEKTNNRREAKELKGTEDGDTRQKEAVVLLSMGKSQKALRLLEEFEQDHPVRDPWFTYDKVLAKLGIGTEAHLVEAAQMIKDIETDLSENASFQALKAKILGRLGSYPESLRAYNRAIELDDTNTESREILLDPKDNYVLAVKLVKARKFYQAIDCFNIVISTSKDNNITFRAKADLSATLMHIEQYDKAIPLLRECVELYPKGSWIYSNLGIALEKIDSREEALKMYQQALQIDKENRNAIAGVKRLS